MAVRGRCVCPGHWRYRLSAWVVTQRNYAMRLQADGSRKQTPSRYSELKCRVCQNKWRSAGDYVASLPDYQERKYGKLTDADALQLIRVKRLHPHIYTGEIWKQHNRFGKWQSYFIRLKQTPDKKHGHLFVDLKHNGSRRWLSVARLIWMAAHDALVPAGFDVDHKNSVREDNRACNLDLLSVHINRGRNGDDYPYDDDF